MPFYCVSRSSTASATNTRFVITTAAWVAAAPPARPFPLPPACCCARPFKYAAMVDAVIEADIYQDTSGMRGDEGEADAA
eukprot:7236643-Prymnesium_polylepis.1